VKGASEVKSRFVVLPLGRVKDVGSLVIPEIHNSMIFMANEECP